MFWLIFKKLDFGGFFNQVHFLGKVRVKCNKKEEINKRLSPLAKQNYIETKINFELEK